MKTNTLIATAIAVACLAASTASLAEGPDWDQIGYPGTPAQQRQWDIQRQQQVELESQSGGPRAWVRLGAGRDRGLPAGCSGDRSDRQRPHASVSRPQRRDH